MKIRFVVTIALFICAPVISFAQKDTLVKKLDSLSLKSDTTKKAEKNDINPKAYNDSTRLSFHNYFVLLGNDIKQEITLPFNIKRKDWNRFAVFTAAAAALSFTDKSINKIAVDLRNHNDGVASVSSYVTRFGGLYEVYTLTGMAVWGAIFKKDKMKTTTLLATQSYITAGAIQFVFKFLTGRQRPNYIDPKTGENATTFHGPFFQLRKQDGKKPPSAAFSSFPSGHTTAAFAAATVFALEYRDKPLIPIISYTAASMIGFSRLTENRHWPTDILFGAGFGFITGRQVVNNYHRFSKIKQPTRPGRNISFHMEELQGRLLPGLTYNL